MRPFQIPAASLAAILLVGCNASPTWKRVTAVRIDSRGDADPSATYAREVSAALQSARVEHKVVTYQFRYRTHLRDEAITTRTAVVYRDGTDTRNPWWLAEFQQRLPQWLPGDDLARQMTFHVHGPAEVLSVDEKEERDNKRVIGSEDGEVRIARRASGRDRNLTPDWFQRLFTRRTPALRTATAKAAPSMKSPGARSLALFKARHGTSFDAGSMTDRLKMEALQGKRSAKAD